MVSFAKDIDLDRISFWSDPVRRQTPSGARWVRWTYADSELVALWGHFQGRMQRMGVRVFWSRQHSKMVATHTFIGDEQSDQLDLDIKNISDPKDSGLLPYQVPAYRHLVGILKSYPSALDASDTGVGKTYIQCAVARALGLKPVVISPKVVVTSWKRAAAALDVSLYAVCNYEKVRMGNSGLCRLIEQGKKQIYAWTIPDDSMIIFDECQRCKSKSSLNSKLMIAAAAQRIKTVAASATPATTPLEMKALGYLLGLHKLVDFYPWVMKHGVRRNRFKQFDLFRMSGDWPVWRKFTAPSFLLGALAYE